MAADEVPGIILCNRPLVPDDPGLLDMAPTFLHLFGLQPPAEMVGRDVELRTMHELVNDVKQGVGRIVCVLGEAGMGKSRLITETHDFFEQLPGPDCIW